MITEDIFGPHKILVSMVQFKKKKTLNREIYLRKILVQ